MAHTREVCRTSSAQQCPWSVGRRGGNIDGKMRDEKPPSLIGLSLAGLKREYTTPLVTTESLFTAAAGCGKNVPSQFTCRQVPKAS